MIDAADVGCLHREIQARSPSTMVGYLPADATGQAFTADGWYRCAVFGVPDELRRLVADTLATYKAPREVIVVDSIPRLPSGKVLRRTLRDEWAPQVGAAEGRP